MRDDGIVITGIGLVTPLGHNQATTWSPLIEGRSLLDALSSDPSLPFRFSPIPHLNGNPRIFSLAQRAVEEALSDSRIELHKIDSEKVGCSVSVSKPILRFPDSPLPPETLLQSILKRYGLEGPSQNIVAACATGIHSIQTASFWLKENLCNVAIAGSVESSLEPLYISGFQQLGVLSQSPRPFDSRRDGFLLGEGAGIVVLERKREALSRGAPIRSEIFGTSVGSDTNHPTSFSLDGSSIASVLRSALKISDRGLDEIDYIHCHGTGTPLNDLIETRAIRSLFREKVDSISLSSTKGATGHLLGASGSVAVAITTLALESSVVPPTVGLEERDPECDLDYTPLRAKKRNIETACSLSFGFGGPIGAIVLGKPS